jgi:hypothetical protein
MLTIRPAQFATLHAHRVADFKARLRAHLETVLPEAGVRLAAADLDDAVARSVDEARHFGFTRECDVARFVTIALIAMGELRRSRFNRLALTTLHDRTAPPDARLACFEAWAANQRAARSKAAP